MGANENNIDLKYDEEMQVEMEGIYLHGYGVVPKYPMLDPDICAKAKVLYSYLCVCTSGGVSYTSRSLILKHLDMSKKLYYKCLNELKSNGYVSVRQTIIERNKFSKNVYTIVNKPIKFKDNYSNEIFGKIRLRGIMSTGYGFVPRTALEDDNINIYAKAIYCYYCSYTGAGDTAYPKLNDILYHLGVKEDTYLKYRKELIEYGYIAITQRHVDGRYCVPDIILANEIDPERKKIEPNMDSSIKRNSHTIFIFEGAKKRSSIKNDSNIIQGPIEEDTVKEDTVKRDSNISQGPTEEDTVTNRIESTVPIEEDTVKNDSNIIQGPIEEDTVKEDTVKEDTVKEDTISNNYISNNCINNNLVSRTVTIDLSIYQGTNIESNDGLIEQNESVISSETEDKPFIKMNFRMAADAITEHAPATATRPTTDDSLNKSVRRQIESRLSKECQLPYEYREDKEKMRIAIELISEYDDYDYAPAMGLYKMCVSAVNELCMMKNNIFLNNTSVSYANVIDEINEYLRMDGTIRLVLESAVDDFMEASKKTVIHKQMHYMKSCIWNAMKTYRAKLDSFALQLSSGYPCGDKAASQY